MVGEKDEAHLEDLHLNNDLGGKASENAHQKLLKKSAFLLPFCAGFSIPIVSGLNRQLSETLGNGLWAVATNYFFCTVAATALAFLTADQPSRKQSLYRLFGFIKHKPFRALVLSGGLLGALQNVHGSYAVHYIGPQVMTATGLIGQIIFSLIFDASGIFWTRQTAIRIPTVVGVIVAALGCALYQLTAYQDLFGEQRPNTVSVALVIVSFCLGGVTCIQSGVGRKLRDELGRFRRAAAFNYFVGCLTVLCVAACMDPRPRYSDLRWRHMIGLVVPVVNCFNLVTLCLSPLWMSMSTCMTCWAGGQLACSSLLESKGWLQSRRTSALGWRTWCGLCLVMIGLFIKNNGVQRCRSRPSEMNKSCSTTV